MASKRPSDENFNPDTSDTPKAIDKKRLSTQDRKKRIMFEKSGMKKGALFRFLDFKTKKRDPDGDSVTSQPQQPTASTSVARVMSNINANTAGVGVVGASIVGQSSRLAETNNNVVDNAENGDEDGTMANSQDSSVIFEGEFDPHTNKHVELVEIKSRSDKDDDGDSRGDPHTPAASPGNNGTPPCDDEDIQDNEVPSDPSPENRYSTSSDGNGMPRFNLQPGPAIQLQSSVNLPVDEPMSMSDKVAQWQRKNIYEVEEEPFGPTPSKTIRLSSSQTGSQVFERRQDMSPASSCSGSPMMKITSVFSVAPPTQKSNENSNATTTDSSNEPRASSSSTNERQAKDVEVRCKEVDNRKVCDYIKKRNWSRALKLMEEDLQMEKLPKPTYVSTLISQAILCDGARVAKQVSTDSLEFLDNLVKQYRPRHGNQTDSSVQYYKQIFENVFDSSSVGNGNRLYDFFMEMCSRVEYDLKPNTLRLLVFVTDLVYNQFQEFQNLDKTSVKVNPPLFQHFLEEEDARYHYEPYCSGIVTQLFTTKAPELICIYLKWLDLIATKFGSLLYHGKEYRKLVEDVAKHCKERSDLGLFCFLNLKYRDVSQKVCENIFEDLAIIPTRGTIKSSEIFKKRCKYLEHLADTLLIKPAESVILDLDTKICPTNEELTLIRTSIERDLEPPKAQDAKRKNVKGETRLHTLCSTKTIENPLEEFRRHILINPDDINAPDNYGNTPLHDCAVNDKGNIIVELMHLCGRSKIKVKINFLARNNSLYTPLHLAAIHCSTQHAETLKHFASACGVLNDVLLAPNGEGKLPFEVAENAVTKRKLKPEGYDEEVMFVHQGVTLTQESKEKVKSSFALRKIIAWWNKFC